MSILEMRLFCRPNLFVVLSVSQEKRLNHTINIVSSAQSLIYQSGLSFITKLDYHVYIYTIHQLIVNSDINVKRKAYR